MNLQKPILVEEKSLYSEMQSKEDRPSGGLIMGTESRGVRSQPHFEDCDI